MAMTMVLIFRVLTVKSSNSGVWECSPFNTVIDADSDGVLTWNDCDDGDVSTGHKPKITIVMVY